MRILQILLYIPNFFSGARSYAGFWDRHVTVEEVLRLDSKMHKSAAVLRRHKAEEARERERHEKEIARQVRRIQYYHV
jgi:hypothetical protein